MSARLIFLVLCGGVAFAGPITYNVTVDTSSLGHIFMGSLDFNFNPGPLTSQFASLQVLNFVSDGTPASNCPCATGDVTGQLPGTLTFDNGSPFNDYFDDFTFGDTISFQLSFYGPALSAPDGVSTSGSVFGFSVFSDAAGSIPVLTSDTADGFAFIIEVNLDGTTSVTNYSSQTTVTAAGVVSTPESSGFVLFGVGLATLVSLKLGPTLRALRPPVSAGQ